VRKRGGLKALGSCPLACCVTSSVEPSTTFAATLVYYISIERFKNVRNRQNASKCGILVSYRTRLLAVLADLGATVRVVPLCTSLLPLIGCTQNVDDLNAVLLVN
jgi:hypothetical protein